MIDVAAITGIAGLAVRFAPMVRDALATDDAFVRAYYLEVSKNIEVLKTVDIEVLGKIDIASPLFRSLIGGIETGIAVALLCTEDPKRKRLLDFLGEELVIKRPSKSIPIEQDEGEGGTVGDKPEISVNVRKALWFTVQKTELLKTLSALEGGVVKYNFRLHVRIANILERFIQIQRKLQENPAIIAVR